MNRPLIYSESRLIRVLFYVNIYIKNNPTKASRTLIRLVLTHLALAISLEIDLCEQVMESFKDSPEKKKEKCY